jgi:alpha-tubulin suppressor-like RCC1 family protein
VTRLKKIMIGLVAVVVAAALLAIVTGLVSPRVVRPGVVSVGAASACAVESGGTVACWGANDQGQLGDGTRAASATPVAVRGLRDASTVSVSLFAEFACATTRRATVACWGNGRRGQLGTGSFRSSLVARPVRHVADVLVVRAGAWENACALTRHGDVDCWGFNGWGDLGDGTVRDSALARPVLTLHDAVGLGVGNDEACAITGLGAIVCWGYAGSGVLGPRRAPFVDHPVTVSATAKAVAIAVGNDEACAVLGTGALNCWGSPGPAGSPRDANSPTRRSW